MTSHRKESEQNVRLLLNLIERASTLEKAQVFLASRDLHFSSGSWKEFVEDRVNPALKSGALTVDDLIKFLRENEEHGRQHIFLYQTESDNARRLTRRERVTTELQNRRLQHLLDHPDILDIPASPRLADVRWEEKGFIVKIIEPRTYYRQIEEQREGNRITTIREEVRFRAVNVLRLHEEGLLEMRLQSHRNSSRYAADISRTWEVIGTLLPQVQFEEWPIVQAKTYMVRERQRLRDQIRYSDSKIRDSAGYIVMAATPDQDSDLFDNNTAAGNSIASFLQSEANCEQLNVWFRYSQNEEIHVRLGGMPHEFALPAACSREHYNHVLARIREYNQ